MSVTIIVDTSLINNLLFLWYYRLISYVLWMAVFGAHALIMAHPGFCQ